jgi:hypothetical protein
MLTVHPGGRSASKISDKVEQVWEYGRVSIRYRLLPATQQVEVISVNKTPRVSGLPQLGIVFLAPLASAFSKRKTRRPTKGLSR